jgi:hypothetical protein
MDKLLEILKGVAPALATVAMGPAGGAVVSAIANRLGVANEVEAVAQAIADDPEAAQKLAAIDLEQFKAEAADRGNARDREVAIATAPDAPLINKTVTPVLALGTVGASFLLFGLIIFMKNLDQGQQNILIYVLGALNAATVQVLSYYFGASHDHKKDINPSPLETK